MSPYVNFFIGCHLVFRGYGPHGLESFANIVRIRPYDLLGDNNVFMVPKPIFHIVHFKIIKKIALRIRMRSMQLHKAFTFSKAIM